MQAAANQTPVTLIPGYLGSGRRTKLDAIVAVADAKHLLGAEG